MVFNYNVNTVQMASEYHDETKGNREEGRTWSQHFWSFAYGGLVYILYRYYGTALWVLESIFLTLWRVLETKKCSYCLALGAGEGLCQEGEKVWVCKACR